MDLPDFSHVPILAFFVGFALVLGLALHFGGAPERWGALTLLAMPVTQFALYSTVSSDVYGGIDWVSLTVDLIGFAGFTAIMLRAYRHWPIWAWAMTVISSLAHFARINTDMLGFSYAQFKTVPTAAVILLVLYGTVAHQIRLRRDGEDMDWFPFAEVTSVKRWLAKLESD